MLTGCAAVPLTTRLPFTIRSAPPVSPAPLVPAISTCVPAASSSTPPVGTVTSPLTRTNPLHVVVPAGSTPLTVVPAAVPRLATARPALSGPAVAVSVNGPGSAAPVATVAASRRSNVTSLLAASAWCTSTAIVFTPLVSNPSGTVSAAVAFSRVGAPLSAVYCVSGAFAVRSPCR